MDLDSETSGQPAVGEQSGQDSLGQVLRLSDHWKSLGSSWFHLQEVSWEPAWPEQQEEQGQESRLRMLCMEGRHRALGRLPALFWWGVGSESS